MKGILYKTTARRPLLIFKVFNIIELNLITSYRRLRLGQASYCRIILFNKTSNLLCCSQSISGAVSRLLPPMCQALPSVKINQCYWTQYTASVPMTEPDSSDVGVLEGYTVLLHHRPVL